jgi:hypothetical protein
MAAATAPVYSIADEHRARAEAAAWARFVDAADRAEFCASWLALLASRIERARAALLLVADPKEGSFGVAAAWPDPQRDLQYLAPVAQRALGERAGIVSAPGGGPVEPDGPAHVGYPVEAAGALVAAVVLDVGPGSTSDCRRRCARCIGRAAGCSSTSAGSSSPSVSMRLSRTRLVNEVMATALQHGSLTASALPWPTSWRCACIAIA